MPTKNNTTAVRSISAFPGTTAVRYEPTTMPGAPASTLYNAILKFTRCCRSNATDAIAALSTAKGKGVAKAIRGGRPRNVLSAGVSMLLPPIPK